METSPLLGEDYGTEERNGKEADEKKPQVKQEGVDQIDGKQEKKEDEKKNDGNDIEPVEVKKVERPRANSDPAPPPLWRCVYFCLSFIIFFFPDLFISTHCNKAQVLIKFGDDQGILCEGWILGYWWST